MASSFRVLPLLVLIASSFVGGLSLAEEEKATEFKHAASGATFQVPAALVHNTKSSRAKPFSAVFTLGKPPFSLNLIFKEVSAKQTLAEFLKEEKARWKKGGYEAEMTLSETKVGGQKAIKLLRTSRFGELHYLVFASPKDKRLYAFWHMTSKNGDPKRVCLAAMEAMAKSLTFPKKK